MRKLAGPWNKDEDGSKPVEAEYGYLDRGIPDQVRWIATIHARSVGGEYVEVLRHTNDASTVEMTTATIGQNSLTLGPGERASKYRPVF